MAKRTRTDDWGFPRWRAYGQTREAASVRLCDRDGCGKPGDCPAPKSAWTAERWWFCQDHAAEYNRQWNYFEGLGDEAAQARAEAEARAAHGYRRASHWAWTEDGEDGFTRAERDALAVLELDSAASSADIKAAFRRLAKQYHPDVAGSGIEASTRFQAVTAAYDILSRRVATDKSA